MEYKSAIPSFNLSDLRSTLTIKYSSLFEILYVDI